MGIGGARFKSGANWSVRSFVSPAKNEEAPQGFTGETELIKLGNGFRHLRERGDPVGIQR